MNIGTKIRNARVASGLTQEAVAERLGVSRQTISNWENGRTYPDIVSVVTLSTLYDVSLDHLLKEDTPMTQYLNYLDESTNTVKNTTRRSRLLVILTYLVIWGVAISVFWLTRHGTDALGYSIMFLWIVLPITVLILSGVIGARHFWGRAKWFAPLAFGLMHMLAEYATFSLANTAQTYRLNAPDPLLFALGALTSLVGLAVGHLIHTLGRRRTSAA